MVLPRVKEVSSIQTLVEMPSPIFCDHACGQHPMPLGTQLVVAVRLAHLLL